MATTLSELSRTDAQSAKQAGRAWTMPVAIGILALVLRLWAPGPVTQTQDEYSWLLFSSGFRTAVVDGNFSHATAGQTMPGVTTMWAGTLGYASVALAHDVGLAPDAPQPFSASVLRASRGYVALFCSIALAAFVAVAALLVSRRAAAIAGVLLATEPFLVGHSDVLHTDGMVTMFGALSAVALMAGLRARRQTLHRTRMPLVLLSGVSAGLAVLTKLNAVPLVLGAAAVIMAAEVLATRRDADGRPGWWRPALRENGRIIAFWGFAALVVIVVLWPAVWVAPAEQIRLIRVSLDQLKRGQGSTFFRERVTPDAGVTYYPVAMLFRMTPWLLTGSVVASVAVVVRSLRGWRRAREVSPANHVALTLLLCSVPYALIITFTSQKYDRYGLPVFPFLAIACGVVLAEQLGRLRANGRAIRWVLPVGLVVTALLAFSTLRQAPYAISYVDPLAGGQVRARRNILLGWGEGLERLGAELRHREGKHCDSTRILGPAYYVVAFPCGHFIEHTLAPEPLDSFDYYVTYVNGQQRRTQPDITVFAAVRRTGTLVKTVRIEGLTYAEMWKVRR